MADVCDEAPARLFQSAQLFRHFVEAFAELCRFVLSLHRDPRRKISARITLHRMIHFDERIDDAIGRVVRNDAGTDQRDRADQDRPEKNVSERLADRRQVAGDDEQTFVRRVQLSTGKSPRL